jgi:hypothetical protein
MYDRLFTNRQRGPSLAKRLANSGAFVFWRGIHQFAPFPVRALLLIRYHFLQGGTASVCHGIIAGTTEDKYGHVFVDNMSGKGDSGGGIFAATTGKLMGMVVGRSADLQKSHVIPASALVVAVKELLEVSAALTVCHQHLPPYYS